MQSHKKTGFTLIELLVVVAIIALLISILLPSLNQARKQAKQLICNTHLRSFAEAGALYAYDNDGSMPCGLLSNAPPTATQQPSDYSEYGMPAIVLLKYFSYDAAAFEKANVMTIKELFPASNSLYRYPDVVTPAPGQKRLEAAFGSIEFYQCPDHPDLESPLDYVTNAMPAPFSLRNAAKSLGAMQPEDETAGVPVASVDYYGSRKLTDIGRPAVAADVIYVVENLAEMRVVEDFQRGWAKPYRFYHFFMGYHLPFAGEPRIARDKRHPSGVNAAFFDGHAESMTPSKLDPGWPNGLATRMRYFTPLDPSLRNDPAYWGN